VSRSGTLVPTTALAEGIQEDRSERIIATVLSRCGVAGRP
jgi:hypothetical protein